MSKTSTEFMEIDKNQPISATRSGDFLLNFQFVESIEALAALENDWSRLDERVGNGNNIFQSFPWCWHWADHATRGENPDWKLKILTAREGGRLVLVWPLAVRQLGLISEALWLGEPLTQYGDVLVETRPVTELWLLEAWRKIISEPDIDVVHLRKVREDSAITTLLAGHAYKLPGRDQSPCLDLTPYENFDELNKTYKSRKRKDIRRKRRRLQEIGKLRFEIIPPGPKAEAALVTAVGFKNAWLKSSGRHNNTFSDDDTIATLRAMVGGKNPSVECLVSNLHLDHEPIAVEIGFASHKCYMAHIGAFNPWFHVYSPGKIQMESTIGELIERGYQCYDMMAPNDRYKTEWSSMSVGVTDHAMPVSLRGVVHMGLYLRLIRPSMKAIYHNMPESIRRKAMQFS